MAVAADVVRAFSADAQVLFFTCHDQQAEQLKRQGAQPDQSDLAI